MKQLTIQEMIERLEELKYSLGGDCPVYFFAGKYKSLDGSNHEHTPFEVEEIEYREWENSSLWKLIIK